MKKNFVLDTNIVLYDPKAIFSFQENNVYLPIYVLEEVDKFKHEATERGRNARQISRSLDSLRAGGSLNKGSPLPSGGMLFVYAPSTRPQLLSGVDTSTMDSIILQSAIDIRASSPEEETIFITMDVNLRVRADAVGMVAQTYESSSVALDDLDTGVQTIEVEDEDIGTFFQEGKLHLEGLDIPTNTGVNLQGPSDGNSAIGRFDAKLPGVRCLSIPREGVMGIRPRNREQSMALELLLDDKVQLVTLVGKAGTGKTLFALAAALQQTVEQQKYTRILVSRPVMPLGKDIGFLPGSVDEKLNPWMQPIFDNLEFLFSQGKKKPAESVRAYAEIMESGQLQVEPLTYIRGRSLPQQFIIVDEAQNLTPHEVKTIITRAGEGTKIVLTGDPGQIDNPYVDSASNGLTVAANKFRGQSCAGHIVLSQGERSELADLATALL
jgi:PhoH-like ATPase